MTDAPKAISERDTVRFYHPASDKRRTGVVIQIQDEAAIVIYGQGRQLHDLGACEAVRFPSSEASSLDLYKTTYFHARCVIRISLSAVERVGRCLRPCLLA